MSILLLGAGSSGGGGGGGGSSFGDLSMDVETTTSSETFNLGGALLGASINATIDWGDGSSDAITTNSDPALTHTYTDAGTYTINLTGTCTNLRFFYGGSKLKVKKVNKVDGDTLGMIRASTMFYGCQNLTTIEPGCFDSCTGFNSSQAFYYAFYDCRALTAIPSGLFDNLPQLISNAFESTFYQCLALTSIPTGLFAYNTLVTNFYNTFRNCQNLSSIPSGLFDNNTVVAANAFRFTFRDCISLTSIPSSLFDNNTLASSYAFNETFKGCTSLTAIPANLFDNNTAVSTFGFLRAFENCTSLATIPANLFDNNINCNQFNNCFTNCALTEASVDNFLVSLDDAGLSNGIADCNGGTSSAPSITGLDAETNLTTRGWTISTN